MTIIEAIDSTGDAAHEAALWVGSIELETIGMLAGLIVLSLALGSIGSWLREIFSCWGDLPAETEEQRNVRELEESIDDILRDKPDFTRYNIWRARNSVSDPIRPGTTGESGAPVINPAG